MAANPNFYVLAIGPDNNATLHSTQAKFDPAQKLPVTVLESKQSACCFVFGRPSKNNEEPLLSSSRGDESYQFLGAYWPTVAEKADVKLGFGMMGMSGAKLVGNRTYEVSFSGATQPVFVRHCLGSEGINFKLYHALTDRKPYISYYFALGYDVEPDCPAKQ